tara:strand:- start:7354 stop:10338 length:2985 start_codon:yes stop_codon:yes gene_type:complete
MQGPGLYPGNQNLMQQLAQQQLGYTQPGNFMQNQYSGDPRNMGSPFSSFTDYLVGRQQYDRGISQPVQPMWDGGRREMGRSGYENNFKHHIFNESYNQFAYSEGRSHRGGQESQSLDRRIDRAMPMMHRLGYISNDAYDTWQNRDNDPSQARNIANMRAHVGNLINTLPQLNDAMGGFGNSAAMSEGMSNLAETLIQQNQGALGRELIFEEDQKTRGSLQRQLSEQMMRTVFREDGRQNAEYGTFEQMGTILNEFAEGGGLQIESLMKNVDGVTTIDPEQFKTRVGDSVKKMVDTLDALSDVYEGVDTKTLMDIGGLVTGLDPQDIRHAGRINATVRETMTQAREFAMDPKEYVNMIQQGAQMLTAAGFDQQASGNISQYMAAFSGNEMEMQRAAELSGQQHLGFQGTQRDGFRAMSMGDIHKRNMLNFGGALQDRQLTQASLGLTELLQQHEMQGGLLSEEQEKELRNMMTYGPESREQMLQFATRMQEETGFNVLNGSGTNEQRMSSFQVEDTERFRNLMLGTTRATNRTLGIQNVLKNAGLAGSIGGDNIESFSGIVGNIGGDKTVRLLNQLQDMEGLTGDEKVQAAEEFDSLARSTFSGAAADYEINRQLSSVGLNMQEMVNNDTTLDSLNDEQKTQLLIAAGFDPATMEDAAQAETLQQIFSGQGGTLNQDQLVGLRSTNKVTELEKVRQNIEDQVRAANPEASDAEVSRQVKGRLGTMSRELNTASRNAQMGPSDEVMARTEQEAANIRHFEQEQEKRRANRLDVLDVSASGGFFEGVADGAALSQQEISDRLREEGLSQGDLRGARGDIARQIMMERDKHTKSFVASNKEDFLGEDGVLDTLQNTESDAGKEMLDRVADRLGITGSAEEKRRKAQQRIKKIRESHAADGKLDEDQDRDFNMIAEELVRGDDESSTTFRETTGIQDKVESDAGLQKTNALEETLANIDQMLRTQNDMVQQVTFAEPLTARLISDEGGLRIILSSEHSG